VSRPKREESAVTDDQDALLAKVKTLKQQVESLEKEVHRLQLKRDVLEVTAEMLKTRPGRRSKAANQPGKGNSDQRPEDEIPPG